MTKKQFLDKYKDQLQQAIWKEEIEAGFLEYKLDKQEEKIVKHAETNHQDFKKAKKQGQALADNKMILERMFRDETGAIEATKEKLEFLETFINKPKAKN